MEVRPWTCKCQWKYSLSITSWATQNQKMTSPWTEEERSWPTISKTGRDIDGKCTRGSKDSKSSSRCPNKWSCSKLLAWQLASSQPCISSLLAAHNITASKTFSSGVTHKSGCCHSTQKLLWFQQCCELSEAQSHRCNSKLSCNTRLKCPGVCFHVWEGNLQNSKKGWYFKPPKLCGWGDNAIVKMAGTAFLTCISQHLTRRHGSCHLQYGAGWVLWQHNSRTILSLSKYNPGI